MTTSITGQIKNIVTTLLGFVLFGGVSMGWDGIIGIVLSTLSSVWYAYIKYQQSVQRKKANEEPRRMQRVREEAV